MGKKVYSYRYIEKLREHNINLQSNERVKAICPQAGFQENVCLNDADILVIGGKRGGGKTFVCELAPMRYVDNPLFTIHGFRKEEDDIKRGLWRTSLSLYSELAEQKASQFTWTFPSGATSIYEHLQNEANIDRRFRGVEMPYILIDELTQISAQTFFTLLASNRNTIGVRNQFVATCNPVGETHWVHKLLSWYIDPNTFLIIPERNGVKRYFYKYGREINEIIWGNSKEDVYEKGKDRIDPIFDKKLTLLGRTPYDLINSICFIEGTYAENKLFIKRDPNYLGNLAQSGGATVHRDILGIWKDDEETENLLPSDLWEKVYTMPGCDEEGTHTGVADVALSRDAFVLGAFRGNRLVDIESYRGIGSMTALTLVKKFLEKNHIPLRNFIFDSDGIGNYLKEPLLVDKGGSYAFNNNSASSDSQIWYNLKAECTEKFSQRVKEGKFAIEPSLLDKIIDGKTLKESLDEQASVIRRKDTNGGKFQVLTKPEMKILLGGKRSPDIIEMIIMHEKFNIDKVKHKSEIKGLQWLS